MDHNMLTLSIFTDNSKPQSTLDRLAVIRWKVTKEVTKPHPAVCVSLKKPTIIVEPKCLQASLETAFCDLQDKLLRSIIEGNKDKLQSIPETSLSIDAVSAFAEQENESKRLSGDTIKAWFDQYISDSLMLTLMSKQGLEQGNATETQLSQIAANVNSARDMVASLASPRSMYPETTIHQLQKVISLASEETDLATTLNSKLTTMLQPKAVTLAFNL